MIDFPALGSLEPSSLVGFDTHSQTVSTTRIPAGFLSWLHRQSALIALVVAVLLSVHMVLPMLDAALAADQPGQSLVFEPVCHPAGDTQIPQPVSGAPLQHHCVLCAGISVFTLPPAAAPAPPRPSLRDSAPSAPVTDTLSGISHTRVPGPCRAPPAA